MTPRAESGAARKRSQPSSPASNKNSPKKVKLRSDDDVDEADVMVEDRKPEPQEPPDSLLRPQGDVTITRTPASSPPPQDTQVASQFYYPPLAEQGVDDDDETIWGYLWPLTQKNQSVIKLNKTPQVSTPNKESPKGAEKKKPKSNKKHGTGGFVIGRHVECDLVIDHNENAGSQPVAVLEDLSSNGTWVAGVIIGRNRSRTLENGDEIEFPGGFQYTFRYPPHMQSSDFRNAYDLGQQLGSGHFATVHLAVEKKSGQEFAVKIFRKRRNEDKSKTSGLQQEIAVLMSVNHPNILCLQGTYDEDDGVYLVLELAREGELFNYIIRNTKLSEVDTRKVFIQLFNGLKYLHERNIVHRDIKPENILLCDTDLTVKLADFGLAKIIGEDSFTTSLCGTPSCLDVAPEILEPSRNRKYTRAVDMWSLGVVLYICLCGFPPFSDELYTQDNPYNLSQQIREAKYDFPSPYWDDIADPALYLIESMLEVNPNKRITVDMALKHAWTVGTFNPAESCDSLVGALETMGLRRSVGRERTLLAEHPEIRPTRAVEAAAIASPVTSPSVVPESEGGAEEAVTGETEVREGNPSDIPAVMTAFMHVGGRGGDETLYPDDSFAESV
ncbi:Pkinase-domain-containing protein [Tuber magnatum]|uniref:Pkinase-domain-containing protein n=1 Tax=Tuber magnatum TaxID=42249 RepID=A0A317SPA0_9PEZI|nr:Pkinase-domain-containing protein [Tuber magnatum]